MDAAPIPVETLLAHREWVRTVARAVVRDPSAADDVEQETWLAAMSSPPRSESSLRGWLGAVVRSRARRIGRSDARRETRETAAARSDATQSAAELVEIADTHRRVVQAVVELAEPYRQTILLRYFEGLAVEDVAARMSVPLDTARSRISRGLAKLRERLSREMGADERPLALALAPLIGVASKSRPTAAVSGAALVGGSLVTAKTIAGLAAVAALVAFVGWRALGSRVAKTDTPAVVGVEETAPARADLGPRQRVARAESDAPAPAAAVTPSSRPSRSVEERLKDLVEPMDFSGQSPLTAIARIAEATKVPIVVTAEAAQEMAQLGVLDEVAFYDSPSGADLLGQMTKRFIPKFVVEADRVVIVPRDGRWDHGRPFVDLPAPPAAPRITVLGRVVDAHGAIVVGAEVVHVGSDLPRTTTDVAGRYELKLRKPFGEIQARLRGHVSSPCVDVDGPPDSQVTIDLALGGPGGTLRVRVVGKDGPLPCRPGAQISGPNDVDAKLPDGRAATRWERFDWTDDDGVAVFLGVPVGETDVAADCSVGCRGYESPTTKATVTAGGVVEVELKVARKASLAQRVEKARVTLKFRETKLADVIHALGEASDLDTCVTQAVAAMGQERTVTLDLNDAPLADALRDVCHEVGGGLRYKLEVDHDWIFFEVEKR